MARIPYFDPATATGRAKDVYAKIPALNVFKMLGHAGDLIDGFMRMGNGLLIHGKLDPVLREIAIIRVGVLSGAAYEVQQHRGIGRKLGMSEALLDAIAEGPESPVFDEDGRIVMRFTDDVVLNVRASDATFDPVRARFSLGELQELLLTIGFYMMVSRFLETLDVDLEADESVQGVSLPGMKEAGQ